MQLVVWYLASPGNGITHLVLGVWYLAYKSHPLLREFGDVIAFGIWFF